MHIVLKVGVSYLWVVNSEMGCQLAIAKEEQGKAVLSIYIHSSKRRFSRPLTRHDTLVLKVGVSYWL